MSSHLLNEMQLMADHVIVIAKGRLVADESMPEFVARSTRNDVFARSPERDAIVEAVAAAGFNAVREGDDGLSIVGMSPEQLGDIAFRANARIWELTRRTASLEQAFLELTNPSRSMSWAWAPRPPQPPTPQPATPQTSRRSRT